MEVVLVVERVARLGGRPCDVAIGHEQAAHHAHAAVRNRLTGRVVVRYRHAIAVLGNHVHAEARPSEEERDRNRRDVSAAPADLHQHFRFDFVAGCRQPQRP